MEVQYSTLEYRGRFTLRNAEVDARRRATIPALTRIMQEAAMQNVIQLKLSVWDLESHNLSWVLLHQTLEIERLPRLGQNIEVITYPAGFAKLFTYRDFRILDEKGEPIAHAATAWMLMDTETRRMRSIPDFILDFRTEMPKSDRCLPRPSRRVPRLDHPRPAAYVTVHYHDLDFNHHLSNTLYIQWMMDILPPRLLEEGHLQKLDLHFRGEGRWGQNLRVEWQPVSEREFLHRLVRVLDEKEIGVARTVWE